MNSVAKVGENTPALTDSEFMQVMQSSLYPGASEQSITLVVNYCKAAQLDPMQKPVHIVPMWDGKAKAMRDQVMPGIGLYRIQASRNGCAGISEPEFGPDVTSNIGGVNTTYPSWCRVTVKRLLSSGLVAEFSAKEFWLENYAVKGGKERSIAPNAMWSKRPYGQIAKCAEAQALRKGFPEIGSQPTADEMEGKALHDDVPESREITPQGPAEYPAEQFAENLPRWKSLIESGKKSAADVIKVVQSKGTLTEDQKESINALEPIEGELQESAA